MAQRAIDASRAAGTLWVMPPRGARQLPATGTEAVKLEMLRDASSLPIEPDPAAAVGEMPSVQIPGSPGLTEQERGKLEAIDRPDEGKPEGGEEEERP